MLAARPDMRRFIASAPLHDWMVTRGSTMVGHLCAASVAVTGDFDEHIPAPQPSDAQVPADVDIQAVAEVAVESIAALLFETDNLVTQRLIDDQCRLTVELEQRTLRMKELRDQVQRDQTHPFRPLARHTASDLKRRFGKERH